jgi:hypothetical protein
MPDWKILSIFAVPGAGVLSFLRVVSNEIQVVEAQMTGLQNERQSRHDREEKWGVAVVTPET